MKARERWRLIAAITVGNCFELFDFTLFSFLAVTLSRIFFPGSDHLLSLLLTLVTFGAGFVTRPLGALLFGSFADRRGRKPAITGSMMLMTIGTAVVAFCPSHSQIGIAAPFILLLGRLLQGLGIGGEIGASTTLLLEMSPPGRKALYVSLQMASQGGAAVLGATAATLLNLAFSRDMIEGGAWRLPFILGLVLGPIGLYLRAGLRERSAAARPSAPFRTVFRDYRASALAGALILLSGTSSMYVVVFYMPTYLIRTLSLPPTTAYVAGCTAGLVMLLGAPLSGAVADRFNLVRPFVLLSSVASALLVLPAFGLLIAAPPAPAMAAIVAILVSFTALGSGTGLTLILSAFPPELRATGLSLVYSMSVSIVGGFAQSIVTWLISATGSPTAPAWYVVACCLVSILGIVTIKPAAPRA